MLFGAGQTMFEPHINNDFIFSLVRIEGRNQSSIAYDFGRGNFREKSQTVERYNLMLLSLVADDYRKMFIS
jgi:hypothetical protein